MNAVRHSENFDAIIVGYGPVGATMAGLLAHRGWRIAVIDRMADVYPLPRAAVFDGEIMRVFQELGLAERFLHETQAGLGAEFVTADGRRIEGFDLPPGYIGTQGWPDLNFFHQPTLEHALRQAAEATGRVTAYLSHEAGLPKQFEAHVEIDAAPLAGGPAVKLSAPFLLAADGASSPIRKHLGFAFDSLGYDHDWLVMDVVLRKDVGLSKITQQICDPARRTTYVPMVAERRRWEFMLNPGETREEMLTPEKQWSLLARWVTPENALIERSAVYQFHAATANRWRDRRIMLLGDAVHQTPPFLGQGMCAGIRDAANLAWKLDYVRRGLADLDLLDTYQEERLPHALDLVDHAVCMGRLIDDLAQAQITGNWPRSMDAVYGGSRGFPHLHTGILSSQSDADDAIGYLAPQCRVALEGRHPVQLDDLASNGFAIISRAPLQDLTDRHQAFIEHLGLVKIVLPEDRRASHQFDQLLASHDAVIMRPDRYIYGIVNRDNPMATHLDQLSTWFNHSEN